MTKPLVTNAASKKQVKQASMKERFNRRQQLEDIRAVMSSDSGKRFVWRYLDECGVFRSSYDPSGSKVYFLEGTRSVGNKILSDVLEACPKVFADMMLENAQLEQGEEHDDSSDAE